MKTMHGGIIHLRFGRIDPAFGQLQLSLRLADRCEILFQLVAVPGGHGFLQALCEKNEQILQWVNRL